MGGHAFSSGPDALNTPRMSPSVYRRAKAYCHAILRKQFVYVASPIEGPGKADFGDIDILVALEASALCAYTAQIQAPRKMVEVMDDIKSLLHADAMHLNLGASSANIAIPWSPSLFGITPPSPNIAGEIDSPKRACHIQVDIRICEDMEDLQWQLFILAHGDIWNLLGSTIRPFGLTVNDQALWLRIPEIEKLDRKKSMVFLTRDPDKVLDFLQMDAGTPWERPFDSVQAMFDYVASCRLFVVRPTTQPGELPCEGQKSTPEASAAGAQGGPEGHAALKANDRKRMRARPVFRQWIDEYLPKRQAEPPATVASTAKTLTHLRGEVCQEACDYFHVKAEFEGRATAWRLARQHDEIWRTTIKGSVAQDLEPPFRACLVNALRKIILEDDPRFGLALPGGIKDESGFFDLAATRQFVLDIQGTLGPIAWEVQKERGLEIQRQKRLQRAALLNSNQGPNAPSR